MNDSQITVSADMLGARRVFIFKDCDPKCEFGWQTVSRFGVVDVGNYQRLWLAGGKGHSLHLIIPYGAVMPVWEEELR